jgi:hypothetical protein
MVQININLLAKFRTAFEMIGSIMEDSFEMDECQVRDRRRIETGGRRLRGGWLGKDGRSQCWTFGLIVK